MKTPLQTQRQSGAALVIGLILLLILTVLGVSGLGTATMEVRFADNAKQKEYAFQGAESAARAELTGGPVIVVSGTELLGSPVRPPANYTYELDTGGTDPATVNARVNTRYRNRLDATGGFQIDKFDNVNFEIQSDATAARGARSRVRQGFFIPAPSN